MFSRPRTSRRTGPRLVAAAVALALGATIPLVQAAPAQAVADPASYVNTLIGTDGGETLPGAVSPFGMVQFSPEETAGNQTRPVRPGGYHYSANKIRGFSMTHMSGTGCHGGSGDIPFMPYIGNVTSSPTGDTADSTYASSFSHSNETATAGYYRVGLDNGTNVELTASARTGSARFTYPANGAASLLVRTSNSEVGSTAATTNINVSAQTISGSVTSGNFCGGYGAETNIARRSYYTLYFTASFDQPFTAHGTWTDKTLNQTGTSASGGTGYGEGGFPAGKGSGGYVTFASGKVVNARIGVSYVSPANAQANLQAENPADAGFDTIRQRARDAWNTELGRMEVTGGTSGQLSTFYTALYHSLLHPNVFSDVNGQYMGMDQQVKTVGGGQNAQYANFSGWDVYRGQLQLVTMLRPDVGGDIAQSLYNHAQSNGGVWDRWTHNQGGTHVMTGDPAHAALPSIYAFGGKNFDTSGALSSMVRAATTVTPEDKSMEGWNIFRTGERPSLDKWMSLHYIPTTFKGGTAWGGAGETLEVSIADFALSPLAGRLGQTETRDAFAARAQYWKNIYNPGNGGYIQDRDEDGTWDSFDPASDSGFAEGSAAQYTWMIPHNVGGLIAKMGGNATANNRLDAYFHNSDGSWALKDAGGLKSAMDNEPSIWTPWFYNHSGQPYKTQQTIRQTVNTLWGPNPTGIPGQDDLGAMSAWYVFAAIGMHPLTPGRAEMLLSSPLFPKVVIHRGNGVDLTVNAPGASAGTFYIQSLKVDGAASNRAWLPESFIASSATLDYTLGTSANTSWAAAAADAPPSFDGAPQGTNPTVTNPGNQSGTTGSPASVQLTATGGTAPYTWSATGLPAGLSIAAGTGLVTGTPTTVGSSSVTVTAKDAANRTGSTTFTWTVADVGASTNLALGRTATGSASCNSGEGPEKAVNGSTTDKWCSSAASKWLQVDLGASRTLGSFKVKHAGAGGEATSLNTKAFTIQVSADGITWNTVTTVTANTSSETTHPVTATTGRYIRLTVTTPTQSGDSAARVYELEAYAP
ncbi:GH92 family glycosyl hydrolase [Longispora sp. NPDC051575]|uniref:GH92 family glycosyl hydrolase n=1 Tax=Longispora sp. NPDC051575 TaxID=3154943 RepID=UPI00342E39D8